jgi:NitT/TauT family transport system ATP-binding protein
MAKDHSAKLEVRGAGKRYGDFAALKDCTFDVGANRIVSIVGPSGCGKTTLLWSMSGLHRLTEGEVLLDGKPVTGPHPDIGLVFQEANLLPWRTLMGNILFPFEIKHRAPERDWIDHLLDRVKLKGFESRYPRELSGGMQQRAAIVRALALRPSVLLMDEPFGALDPLTRAEVRGEFRRLQQHLHKTVVIVTHDLTEAFALGQRVGVLDDGELVVYDTPGRVAASNDPRVRAFVDAAPAPPPPQEP